MSEWAHLIEELYTLPYSPRALIAAASVHNGNASVLGHITLQHLGAAHVRVGKYADCLPLYRQSQIHVCQGIELDRSTLADWVGRAAAKLRRG